MIQLFPELKRLTIDGFRDSHDYRDPYEIYFGLFGRDEGDGGPSGGDERNKAVEREKEQESRGTTFGVDGRSKTGSTEKDREIGFTDGAGGPGRNFDALDKATSEQTATAVAAADAAKAAGASERAGQRAVANALGGYQEGSVNKSGGLSDTGKSLVAKAVESGIKEEEEAIQQELAVADELQRLAPSAIPDVAPAPVNIGFADDETTRVALLTSEQAAAEGITAAEHLAAKAAVQGQTVTDGGQLVGPNLIDIFSEDTLDPAAGQEAQRARAAQELAQRQQALDAVRNLVGASPVTQGLAAADQLQAATSGAQPSAATAAAEAVAAGSGTLSPAEQLNQQVQGLGVASPRTPEQQAGVTPAGPMGAQAALGTPAENFYADAYRELNPQIETIPGTTAAGVVGGITNLFGGDAPTAEDQAAFQSGQMMSLPGSEMDPATGAITAPAGQGELNMNRFGMVTYSGMPDPNYSGPFSDLVNPSIRPEGSGDSLTAVAAQQTQVDPCPAGYELDPATQKCVPIDVVDDQQFSLGRRQYGPSETPSLIGTPVSPFPSPTLQPTAPNMGFLRPAVNPFGFARGGIVELPKK
jgi:hypothetical protein